MSTVGEVKGELLDEELLHELDRLLDDEHELLLLCDDDELLELELLELLRLLEDDELLELDELDLHELLDDDDELLLDELLELDEELDELGRFPYT